MNERGVIPALPDLGGNLRKMRTAKHLTLSELAAVSGISKAMLSQIEANRVNPTIATLWKLAHGLEVELEALISGVGARKKRFEVLRKENLPTLATLSDGAKFTVLSPPGMAEDLEFYRVELAPGCEHVSQAHQAGTEELLTVVAGVLEAGTQENRVSLKSGDTLVFQSDIEHWLKNSGELPAELYMVVRFKRA